MDGIPAVGVVIPSGLGAAVPSGLGVTDTVGGRCDGGHDIRLESGSLSREEAMKQLRRAQG